MNNKNRSSLISARAGFLGGRFKARLRVYTLGAGEEASLYFSVHLWHAATRRQEQLSRDAAFAAR
ncbi:MAG: hypothetical protein HY550_10840 [Elusimicrobia bacterium]|nr:hypothetical protein [Elusimicrobiota bacterium]